MITQRKGIAKHIALSLTSGVVWFAISFIGLNMLLASWMVGYAFRQCIDGNFGIGLPYGLMLGLFVTVPGAAIVSVFTVWRFPPLPMRCICIGLGTMATGIVVSIEPLVSACLGFIAIGLSSLSKRQIYIGMRATLISFSLAFAGGYLTAFVCAKPRHCTHSYALSIPTQRLKLEHMPFAETEKPYVDSKDRSQTHPFLLAALMLPSCQTTDATIGLDVVGYNHTDQAT